MNAGLKSWVKTADHPGARVVRSTFYALRHFGLPAIPVLHPLLYRLHRGVVQCWEWFIQSFYFKPLFRSRCARCGQRLTLYEGMPYVTGPLQIEIGDDCRVSGASTLNGRLAGGDTPRLLVGNNCDIGWHNEISVGRLVRLGDNVRLAGRVSIYGYPGHPLNPEDRAAGLPDTEDQVRDVVLESDVWVGSGATINAGVTVGRGSVIAAGSVVTRDIPAMSLAGGNPARVIRALGAT